MNIIILRDNKGFEKIEIVPRFLPVYEVAISPKLSITAYTFQNAPEDLHSLVPDIKRVSFYPKGQPLKIHGDNVLVYFEE